MSTLTKAHIASNFPLRFKDMSTKEMLQFVARQEGHSMNSLIEEILREGLVHRIDKIEAELKETLELMQQFPRDMIEKQLQRIAEEESHTQEPLSPIIPTKAAITSETASFNRK